MEDDGGGDAISGNERGGEVAEYAGIGQPVQAVPNSEHVEQGPEHRKYHDRREDLEEILWHKQF